MRLRPAVAEFPLRQSQSARRDILALQRFSPDCIGAQHPAFTSCPHHTSTTDSTRSAGHAWSLSATPAVNRRRILTRNSRVPAPSYKGLRCRSAST